jgi:hypothetical protein
MNSSLTTIIQGKYILQDNCISVKNIKIVRLLLAAWHTLLKAWTSHSLPCSKNEVAHVLN